ncbi:MAG: hypothetical protein ACFCGT_05380 [Sandaracinaceae bacterium]
MRRLVCWSLVVPWCVACGTLTIEPGSADAGPPAGDLGGRLDGGPGCATPCPPDRALCDARRGRCVTCTAEDAPRCSGPTPACDVEAGRCVECASDADCTSPSAARCEGNVCTGCTASHQCAGIEGREACDVARGTCGECTAADPSPCGGRACGDDQRCSAYGPAQRTCEACDSDANCGHPHEYCVPAFAGRTTRSAGYCLRRTARSCPRPWGVPIAGRTTLSGVEGLMFCGIDERVTTCEAVRALLDEVECPFGVNADCPNTGICRPIGADLRRCTYRCSSSSTCPAALSCLPGRRDERYCR